MNRTNSFHHDDGISPVKQNSGKVDSHKDRYHVGKYNSDSYESHIVSSNHPMMMNLLRYHTDLTNEQSHHLQRLVAEWQLIADLSFADLSLWVPSLQIPHALVCLAQCRPNTAISVHLRDQVGHVLPASNENYHSAIVSGRVITESQTQWIGTIGIRSEAIPVRYASHAIGVIAKQTNVSSIRLPSTLEIAYRDSGAALIHMITSGNFPAEHSESVDSDSVKAEDGFIRVDAQGAIVFASINAVAAYKSLGFSGDIVNMNLADVTSGLVNNSFESEEIQRLFRRAFDHNRELRREIESSGVTVSLRVIPLIPRGQKAGAIVLVKDLTEVKQKDRALLSKDAIIREIHHRVKNNLQSVSALLRLQSRRSSNPETQKYLNEAVRRIAAISTVHDTLSMSVDEMVDFDEILSQLIPTIDDISPGGEKEIRISIKGRIGVVSAQIAMPIAMIITEVLQNSMEHAFVTTDQGTITITCQKTSGKLVILMCDDGIGLPKDFALTQRKTLGLYIVSSLVSTELQGEFSIFNGKSKGTVVQVTVPLLTLSS